MAWTQAELDALKRQFASGVLKVEHGENKVTYNTLSELKAAIDMIEARLSGRSRVSYPAFTRD